MARYLPNNADTLNPCTFPPRVRCEPQICCWSPSLTFRARKIKFARRANIFSDTSLALALPGNSVQCSVFSVQGVGVVMAFTRSRRFRAIWCSDLSELSFSHHRGR